MNKLLTNILNFSFSGSYEDFSFEHRMFNLISSLNIIGILLALILNFWAGLAWFIQLSNVALLIFISLIYYYSRFKKIKFSYALILLISIDYLYFGLLWFWSGGLLGSTPYLFFALQTVLIIMVKHPWRVIIFTFLFVLILLWIEFLAPGYIIPYPSRNAQFIDYTFGFVITSILVGYAVITLKRDFDYQRKLVNEQNNLLKIMNEEVKQQSEEIKQQNEVLSEGNNQKNKLFSIIAHDFRSPIAAIQTVMEMLIDEELTEGDKKQLAVELAREISYTNSFVDNLLHWSKSQMQKSIVNPIHFPLHPLVEENLKVLRLQFSQKRIKISNQIDPAISLWADREMINLVLRNLLSNAIKFTYANGEITVRASVYQKEIICAIKDNGRGMSDAEQIRLFNHQLAYTKGTANEKGSGLGLLLCKDFVEKNGGKLWFESVEKEGSTFYFSLPN